MKRIIDGKVYNTETATLVAEWNNAPERNPSDFLYEEIEIYKTKSGTCFTLSKMNPYPWKWEVLTGENILKLAEKIGKVGFVVNHFPELLVEG